MKQGREIQYLLKVDIPYFVYNIVTVIEFQFQEEYVVRLLVSITALLKTKGKTA